MIDHLMQFGSEESAKTDPIIGAYFIANEGDGSGVWRGDVCFPHQQLWRQSENMVDPADGTVVIHPQPGWFITISDMAIVEQLRDHANCLLVSNRDVGLPDPGSALGGTLATQEFADYRLAPLPAGISGTFGAC